MFSKLIRSVAGGADKRAQDAQDAAEAALRKLEAASGGATQPMRGSGSWDTDYDLAQEMQPLPRAPAPRTDLETPAMAQLQTTSRVAIHPKRLMDPGHMALYTFLSDQIEADVPSMTLHAQVALNAFLHVDRRAARADQQATHARIAEERVTLLLVDEAGLPAVVVELADNAEGANARAEARAAALDEAGIAVVHVNELTPPGEVWEEVLMHLDHEDDLDAPLPKKAAVAS